MLVIYGFLNLMINTFRKFHDNTIIIIIILHIILFKIVFDKLYT